MSEPPQSRTYSASDPDSTLAMVEIVLVGGEEAVLVTEAFALVWDG